MKKSIVLYLAIITLVAGGAGADLGWEGTAVVGRRGAFPPEGFWAASNSFPRNSVVTVTSLETGRSVDVIIAMRVSEPGVFLSLSDEAGDQLGMDPSVPARVRAVPIASMAATPLIAPIATPLEQPFSADPDINPAAAISADDPVEPVLAEPSVAAAPPATATPSDPEVATAGRSGIAQGVFRTAGVIPAPEPVVADPVGDILSRPEVEERSPAVAVSEPSLPTDPRLEQQPFFVSTTAAGNRMEEAVASVRGRAPAVDLFPPPRGDEVFTFLDVPRRLTIARPIDRRIAEAGLPGDDPIRLVDRPAAEHLGRVEEPRRPLMVELPPVAEPGAPLVATPDPSVEDPERIAEVPESDENGMVLRLEPAEPRPPAAPVESELKPEVATPAEPAPAPVTPERVTVDEWAFASLPIADRLEPSSWYLQVGAFASPRSARNVIDRLEAGFPYTVTPVDIDNRTVFRVFVGPLEQDETGLVLRELRARGHRDAFVRRGGA
ncbi:MAG: SPOR domain-containing protein [Spirochaetaceae bacterium]|nr:MAG: SPOR domain-containing protein [Spirochaetaceae bacterium]